MEGNYVVFISYTLWKERNRKAFDNPKMVDQTIIVLYVHILGLGQGAFRF